MTDEHTGVATVPIASRTDELVGSLLAVWESSVRATHEFLGESDIEEIKGFVPQAVRGVETLVVAWGPSPTNGRRQPVGFMGVDNGRLEMLFARASARGHGIGSALMEVGIRELGVRELIINEQSPQAVGFYQRHGFSAYKRTECDEEGRPFPLVYMRR